MDATLASASELSEVFALAIALRVTSRCFGEVFEVYKFIAIKNKANLYTLNLTPLWISIFCGHVCCFHTLNAGAST
ncbi:hypothetical protein GL58_11640 [Comamonas testosteroni]|uniref:Uncharacterized protein n=1 Tax=Comamonas testosteroni TaxID=285 RepID=A0A0L7ME13_COMTE|nr:hypothetical protein GL58_11640 [Comamonas testosteroni]